jgi:hypothetical protein
MTKKTVTSDVFDPVKIMVSIRRAGLILHH